MFTQQSSSTSHLLYRAPLHNSYTTFTQHIVFTKQHIYNTFKLYTNFMQQSMFTQQSSPMLHLLYRAHLHSSYTITQQIHFTKKSKFTTPLHNRTTLCNRVHNRAALHLIYFTEHHIVSQHISCIKQNRFIASLYNRTALQISTQHDYTLQQLYTSFT